MSSSSSDLFVNGIKLADVVAAIEGPFAEGEGKPGIAGSYSGLAPFQLDGTLAHHFMGSLESHLGCGPEGKSVMLDCECGSPGCWSLMAAVTVTDDEVTWTDFEQVHRRDWDYGQLAFVFERGQYEAALVLSTD